MAEQNLPGEYENPYKFNAKELDSETDLYYYGARYYNPRLSVWYNRFHGNHPAYTNWIRDRFSDLASEGNFNKAGIQGVIKKANSEINKAYKEFQKSGQSLNDYFKKK